jgi:hypothetical protein
MPARRRDVAMNRILLRSAPWLGALVLAIAVPAVADETCQSPYLPKVTGQEDYVYVWTLP